MSTNPTDPFELLKKFWAPLGLPLATPTGSSASAAPGFPGIPALAFPTLDVAELDKRIGDLKSVESWLSLNLEMVRTTIHGFEAQKATLVAFQSMQRPPSASEPAPSPTKRRASPKAKP